MGVPRFDPERALFPSKDPLFAGRTDRTFCGYGVTVTCRPSRVIGVRIPLPLLSCWLLYRNATPIAESLLAIRGFVAGIGKGVQGSQGSALDEISVEISQKNPICTLRHHVSNTVDSRERPAFLGRGVRAMPHGKRWRYTPGERVRIPTALSLPPGLTNQTVVKLRKFIADTG